MTVPVQPGPFSFLAALGQAGGEAVQAAQKEKDKRLKQAQDRLNQMIELRIAGLIPPEAFGSAEAMKLYNTVGITPISTQPTAAETTERLHRTYLAPGHLGRPDIHVPLGLINPGMQDVTIPGQEATGPYSLTPQQRLAIGRPASAESGEALAGAKNQAALGGIQAGGAVGRAVSGVPSEPVGKAFAMAAPNYVAQAVRGATLRGVGGQQFDKYVDQAYQSYVQDAQDKKQPVLPPDQAKGQLAGELRNQIFEQAKLDALVERSRLYRGANDVNPRMISALNSLTRSKQADAQAAENQIKDLLTQNPFLGNFIGADPSTIKNELIKNAVTRYNQLSMHAKTQRDAAAVLENAVAGYAGNAVGENEIRALYKRFAGINIPGDPDLLPGPNLPPLAPQDQEKAKNDPKFRSFLLNKGYTEKTQ